MPRLLRLERVASASLSVSVRAGWWHSAQVRADAASGFVLDMLGDAFVSVRDGSCSRAKIEGRIVALLIDSEDYCLYSVQTALQEIYKHYHGGDGHAFQVIYVSCAKTQEDFADRIREMPWLAIPPGDKRKAALSTLYEVEGIPTFVLVDGATGATINASGRAAVGGDPEGAEFPWYPKPVNDMAEGADGLTLFERKYHALNDGLYRLTLGAEVLRPGG